MLVTWRYRQRNSLVQSFDPRAWLIFFACFLVTTLFFWDIRYLLVLFAIALGAILASRISWQEMAARLAVHRRVHHLLLPSRPF